MWFLEVPYIKESIEECMLMLDELSVGDINRTLCILEENHVYKVLLFNSLPEPSHASTLLQRGIKGYENSYIAKENLLKMIKSIEDGKKWFFSELTEYIINKYIQTSDKREPEFMHLLSKPEKKIALMIADGLSNKEIVNRKKLALSTIKGHIRNIFKKAGVSSRVELALKFK